MTPQLTTTTALSKEDDDELGEGEEEERSMVVEKATTRIPSRPPPRRRRSSLMKGESIRSLKELLDETLLSASLESLPPDLQVGVEDDDDDDDHHDHDQQQHNSNRDKKEEEEEGKDDGIVTSGSRVLPSTAAEAATATATATAITAAAKGKRQGDEVRMRLLQNLGIHKQHQPQGLAGAGAAAVANTNPPPPNNNSNSRFEPWGPTTTIALNDTTMTESMEQQNQLLKISKLNGKRKLNFNPTVQVHPIPSFRVYSNRIRQTIWTGAAELKENVARNSLEFSYEQWDVQRVLDEDTGLFWYQGQYIHPVHVEFLRPEDLAEQKRLESTVLKSSDEFWNQTCQRLGIQPAEFYHSIPTIQ